MTEMVEFHIYRHGWILRGAGSGRQHGDTGEKPERGFSETGGCAHAWDR